MRRTLFDEEHDAFRETVREFASRHLVPHAEQFRRDRGISREVWLSAGKDGLLGIEVPKRYGGSGIDDLRFNVVLAEELARAGLAFASSIGIQVDVVGPYLTKLTTDNQRERWLPGFTSGEVVTAIGMTEPDAGSDLGALRTRAERRGNSWFLNGTKTFITNGASADLVLLAARTGPERRNITLFAVEATQSGYTAGEPLHKIGQSEADTAEIWLEDVELDHDDVIGEVGAGFRHMLDNLPRERLHTAYVNLAHAERVLEVTLDYVTTRNAFGRPIGTFQNSRFRLAEAATMIDVTRAYVDDCVTAAIQGEFTAVDSAKAKWWASDVQNAIIDACLQLHGGYGYMEEYEVARAWTDARVTKIWAGTNEIMKEIIGQSLGLGEPR